MGTRRILARRRSGVRPAREGLATEGHSCVGVARVPFAWARPARGWTARGLTGQGSTDRWWSARGWLARAGRASERASRARPASAGAARSWLDRAGLVWRRLAASLTGRAWLDQAGPVRMGLVRMGVAPGSLGPSWTGPGRLVSDRAARARPGWWQLEAGWASRGRGAPARLASGWPDREGPACAWTARALRAWGSAALVWSEGRPIPTGPRPGAGASGGRARAGLRGVLGAGLVLAGCAQGAPPPGPAAGPAPTAGPASGAGSAASAGSAPGAAGGSAGASEAASGAGPASGAAVGAVAGTWPVGADCAQTLARLAAAAEQGELPAEPAGAPVALLEPAGARGAEHLRLDLALPRLRPDSASPLLIEPDAAGPPCRLALAIEPGPAERRVVRRETVWSERAGPVERRPNPEYEAARRELARLAEELDREDRAQAHDLKGLSVTGNPLIDVLGVVGGLVLGGIGSAARDRELAEAQARVQAIPRTLEETRLEPYELVVEETMLVRRATVEATLVERAGGRWAARLPLERVDRLRVAPRLHPRDRSRLARDGRLVDPAGLEALAASPPPVPLSDLLRPLAERLAPAGPEPAGPPPTAATGAGRGPEGKLGLAGPGAGTEASGEAGEAAAAPRAGRGPAQPLLAASDGAGGGATPAAARSAATVDTRTSLVASGWVGAPTAPTATPGRSPKPAAGGRPVAGHAGTRPLAAATGGALLGATPAGGEPPAATRPTGGHRAGPAEAAEGTGGWHAGGSAAPGPESVAGGPAPAPPGAMPAGAPELAEGGGASGRWRPAVLAAGPASAVGGDRGRDEVPMAEPDGHGPAAGPPPEALVRVAGAAGAARGFYVARGAVVTLRRVLGGSSLARVEAADGFVTWGVLGAGPEGSELALLHVPRGGRPLPVAMAGAPAPADALPEAGLPLLAGGRVVGVSLDPLAGRAAEAAELARLLAALKGF